MLAISHIRSYIRRSKRVLHGVLPFTEEECILLMSIKPRENLPLWQSENFCQHVQKKREHFCHACIASPNSSSADPFYPSLSHLQRRCHKDTSVLMTSGQMSNQALYS